MKVIKETPTILVVKLSKTSLHLTVGVLLIALATTFLWSLMTDRVQGLEEDNWFLIRYLFMTLGVVSLVTWSTTTVIFDRSKDSIRLHRGYLLGLWRKKENYTISEMRGAFVRRTGTGDHRFQYGRKSHWYRLVLRRSEQRESIPLGDSWSRKSGSRTSDAEKVNFFLEISPA